MHNGQRTGSLAGHVVAILQGEGNLELVAAADVDAFFSVRAEHLSRL